MAGSHPLVGVEEFWEEVTDETEATAAEYRDAGWEVVTLHPGDVTALPTASADAESDRVGLDVLVPNDEFDAVEDLVADATFDGYDAYRAEEADVVFLVVAMTAAEAGAAVVFPLYYARSEARTMLRRAAEAGEMRTYVRPLDDDRRVVFTHRDPENLLPEGFDAESGGDSESRADSEE
ncbi:DUF7529 family protein [Candidatus Halobonum tyrrellensis]|uniref:Uncharacterized protein n=1 Tax=Candidatus Halobonum tyrrellensis G22 TaxID=1324957 RepID=V4IWH3_9EURY|nr:hypothetical protein [Candidatus Halobonum tyrrellensis]ESP87537.1 hypothetical protein K933_13731 [Candidatus Halobonum tyrrellensis G22]